MSNYAITTIEQHQASIDLMQRCIDDRYKRIDQGLTDMDDCFLSQWAESNSIYINRTIIQALEEGAKRGDDRPWAVVNVLLDENGQDINAKRVYNEQYQTWSWLIKDEEVAQRIGRKFVPKGSTSRILKKLGWVDTYDYRPVKRFAITHCHHLLGATSVEFIQDREAPVLA